MSIRCFTFACCLLAAGSLSAQARPGDSGSSSAHSTSHRVVVVDGRVVDKGADPAVRALPQEWQDLLERVRRSAEPRGGKAGDNAQTTSSHTRRVVVENGKVVVDEETRDGKPVRHGGGGQQPGQARADARADASAGSHAESSSGHSESSDSSHGRSSRSDKKGNSAANQDARQRDGARKPKAPAPAQPEPKASKPVPPAPANDRSV
jgi:hypothetical protein